MKTTDLVPVHTWRHADGHWHGQGTALEFEHWRAEGIIPDDVEPAELLGHEPASEDDKRRKAWALEVA